MMTGKSQTLTEGKAWVINHRITNATYLGLTIELYKSIK